MADAKSRDVASAACGIRQSSHGLRNQGILEELEKDIRHVMEPNTASSLKVSHFIVVGTKHDESAMATRRYESDTLRSRGTLPKAFNMHASPDSAWGDSLWGNTNLQTLWGGFGVRS
eukprot:7612623-Pyramimonas_sp.AAC.1